MKALKFITMLLITATLLTSCDFFRKMMGKPTSKDLERMKIAAQQAEAKRIQDSINLVKAQELARIAEEEAAAKRLNERFYVIVGSFKNLELADKLFEVIKENGYGVKVIPMQNGFNMVAAASTNDFREAINQMNAVKEFVFCPEDVWIYDVNQALHE